MAAFVGPSSRTRTDTNKKKQEARDSIPERTRNNTIKEIQDANDRITTIQNIIETTKVENPALKKQRDKYVKKFLRLRQNYIANYFNPLPTHKPGAWRDEMPVLAVRNILKFLTLEEIRKYKEAGMLSDSALYMASPVIHSKCEKEGQATKDQAPGAFLKQYCMEGGDHFDTCNKYLKPECTQIDPHGYNALKLKAWEIFREFVDTGDPDFDRVVNHYNYSKSIGDNTYDQFFGYWVDDNIWPYEKRIWRLQPNDAPYSTWSWFNTLPEKMKSIPLFTLQRKFKQDPYWGLDL